MAIIVIFHYNAPSLRQKTQLVKTIIDNNTPDIFWKWKYHNFACKSNLINSGGLLVGALLHIMEQ